MSLKVHVAFSSYGSISSNTTQNHKHGAFGAFSDSAEKIKDMKGNPLLLFVNSWSVGMVLDRNEGLILSEFGRD